MAWLGGPCYCTCWELRRKKDFRIVDGKMKVKLLLHILYPKYYISKCNLDWELTYKFSFWFLESEKKKTRSISEEIYIQ